MRIRRRLRTELLLARREHDVDDDEHRERCHQRDRERRAERPVLGVAERVADDVADELELPAAEDVRDDVLAAHRDEDEQAAGHNAGHREPQRDVLEGGERLGSQVGRRFDQRPVHPLERCEDRQDEERQVVVDQADPDGVLRVEDVDTEVLREVAVRVEDDLERVCPDQERRPERHDDHQQREHLVGREVPRHPVCERVADRDREQRARRGHEQRPLEHRDVERVVDLSELARAERVLDAPEPALDRDREHGQDRHRAQEEDAVVQERRQGQPLRVLRRERASRLPGLHGGRHGRHSRIWSGRHS